MAVRHLMGERRVEVIDGRRFLAGEPSCLTIVKALHLFAPEVILLRREYLKGPALDAHVWREAVAGMFAAKPEQSTEVLATCCELWGAAPGDFETAARSSLEIRKILTADVLSLCDPAAIVNQIAWEVIDSQIEGEATDEPAASSDEPTGLEVMVASVALEFGQDPRAVIRWPYELVALLYEKLIEAGRTDWEARSRGRAKLAEYGVH